jgi:hypothetical protein
MYTCVYMCVCVCVFVSARLSRSGSLRSKSGTKIIFFLRALFFDFQNSRGAMARQPKPPAESPSSPSSAWSSSASVQSCVFALAFCCLVLLCVGWRQSTQSLREERHADQRLVEFVYASEDESSSSSSSSGANSVHAGDRSEEDEDKKTRNMKKKQKKDDSEPDASRQPLTLGGRADPSSSSSSSSSSPSAANASLSASGEQPRKKVDDDDFDNDEPFNVSDVSPWLQPFVFQKQPRIRPPLRLCKRQSENADQLSSSSAASASFLGCFTIQDQDSSAKASSSSEADCRRLCATKQQQTGFFAFSSKTKQCRCFSQLGVLVKAPCEESSDTIWQLHSVSTKWPELPAYKPNADVLPVPENIDRTVRVYLFVSERLASLFQTCRLANHSHRFDYVVYDLRHQVDQQEFVETIMPKDGTSTLRILVFNSCCTPDWVLLAWPERSVLVVSGDESARWGFAHKNGRNWWGPHGPHGNVSSDDQRVMRMPESVSPWFKQYFSTQHVDAYGKDVRFLPLGSRNEFPDPPAVVRPATLRLYVYSFMGAPTSSVRRHLYSVLANDTIIPKTDVFLHVTPHWSTDPNDPTSGYVNTTEYRRIMEHSVFTLCPRGNSVEQYRIYEALECGSIPVISMDRGYTVQRMSKEYLESPMVFVEDWAEAPRAMADIAKDPAALLARQQAVWSWYQLYMRAKVDELEDALILHATRKA